jgi:hypothetical protein
MSIASPMFIWMYYSDYGYCNEYIVYIIVFLHLVLSLWFQQSIIICMLMMILSIWLVLLLF